jgi:hypothetical protein
MNLFPINTAVPVISVLRIRIRDPVLFYPRIRDFFDPASVMEKFGSGIRYRVGITAPFLN